MLVVVVLDTSVVNDDAVVEAVVPVDCEVVLLSAGTEVVVVALDDCDVETVDPVVDGV